MSSEAGKQRAADAMRRYPSRGGESGLDRMVGAAIVEKRERIAALEQAEQARAEAKQAGKERAAAALRGFFAGPTTTTEPSGDES
jgi:hypothetical protein